MFSFLLSLLRRRLLIAALPTIFGLGAAAFRWLRNRRRPSTDRGGTVGPADGETTTRPAAHTLSLHRTADGSRFEDALGALRNQLGARAVGEPDETGFFEVEVEAASWDEAAARLRDAVAAAGADGVVELGEPSGRLQD